MNRPKFAKTDMTANLKEFAILPRKTVGYLAQHLGRDDTEEAERILCHSWSIAYERGLVKDNGNQVSFPIWEDEDGSNDIVLPENELIATLKPNNRKDAEKRWAVTYAGNDSHHTLKTLVNDSVTPRNLKDFAYIDWHKALPEIADAAIKESWDDAEDEYGILKSYLIYTYQKLALQENGVFVDPSKGFAAFNSGLVNDHYKDLFLCFGFNAKPSPTWQYAGVGFAGERGIGKKLVEICPALPARASYFEDVSDLIYDSSRGLYVDYEHILFDNIKRFPISFIRKQLYDRPEMLSKFDELQEMEDDKWEDLGILIKNNPEVSQRLLNELENAITLAQKRTQWNYRTAIPFYYPKGDEMSLLLPLYLRNPQIPDVALVVNREVSGNYQGETVLSLEQAYKNARLICKPQNDWLKQHLPEG